MWLILLLNLVLFAGFCYLPKKKPAETLVLLPFVLAIMIVPLMIYYDGIDPGWGLTTLLFPIVLMPIAILGVYRAADENPLEYPWYGTTSGVLLFILKYLSIIIVFIAVFQYFSPVFFLIFLVGVFQYARAKKIGLTLDVISTIGAAIRQSLPLPTALTSAAYGQHRRQARVYIRVAHWLSQGWPLSEALRRGYWRCPAEVLAAIETGEKINQLPKAIDALQADLTEKFNDYKTSKPVHPWYPVIVLTVGFTVTLALMYFIVPTFAEVISDVSDGTAGLHPATQNLLNIAHWFKGNNGANILFVVLPMLYITCVVIYVRFRRRNPNCPRFLSRLGDRIKWCLPVYRWFEKTFCNMHLARTLRIGLSTGYPINTILHNSLGLDVNFCYRKRIEKWLKKIEAGGDIAQTARQCGFEKTIAWAFDETVNKGNAPQVLEHLETVYRHQYNYRRNMLSAAGGPFVILGIGLCVGYIVYAMFMGAFGILITMLQNTIPQ